MVRSLILASGSATRLAMLRAAGLDVTARPARIDELSIRQSMTAGNAAPRDIADALADLKARKIADKVPGQLVLGCDQILEFQGLVLGKPESPAEASQQLKNMRGQTHRLLSAVVLYDGGGPVWRHVGTARLTMRSNSDGWIDGYVRRNWDTIQHSAGAYLIEQEGIRLVEGIEGDHFTILGLPLLPLLDYLSIRGFIET